MDGNITCIVQVEDEPIRPLPEGKQYHVFFSYREEDKGQEWVRMVSNELRTKYGFLSCNHELDFQPGKKIVENIKDCIRKSVKTVVVLSKGYTESFWCQMELEIILQTGINRKEQILIPICKDELKDIPDYLPLMTCIDARGPLEDWISRLVSAIESPVDIVSDSCFTQHFLQNSDFKTLDTIYEESTKAPCSGPPFETRFVPDYLQRSGIKLNPEIFSNIFRVVSGNRLVKQRMCINPWWPVCVCWVMTVPDVLLTAVIFLGTYFFRSDHDDFYIQFGIVFLCLFAIFGVIWPLHCYRSNVVGKSELKRSLNDINSILMHHNIFVTFNTEKMSAKVTVYFFYYNIQPCVAYIQSRLNTNFSPPENQEIVRYQDDDDDDTPLLDSNNGDTQERTNASEIIINLSQDYFEDFLYGRIGHHIASLENERRRHSSRAMCFCEYAELKKKISLSDRRGSVIVV